MPHATRRTNGAGHQSEIKTEAGSPDHSSNIACGPTVTQTASGSDSNIYEASSVGGDTIPINEAFHRKGRSNAPPPSERPTESEPMLREMRIPAWEMNGIASPPGIEDSLNFQTSFRELGKKLKAHNDTLGELQGLGVSHDVPLPELVLVGDQSAGKSSVMSGLANLDLPRSEGTCTRCPLHIRVSRNADWSCRVSLQMMYKYAPPDNHEINEKDVTDKDPFFPWRKLANSTTTEFKTVHDNSEIEQVLRWAQVAILNPDKPASLFVPGSGALAQNREAETTAKFSPNVVYLEIKGPEMPNLSFYDLPGIFQNSKEARDSYTVHVVRNLSESYIKRESAIVMVSMPMNTDPENSSTFGLVRNLGASHRAVGVLTKADLLPAGGHKQWLDIMEGKAQNTGLGYFITSRPQGRSLDELQTWEEAMFKTKSSETWPEAFHKFEDRCGVEPLKQLLSQKLGEQFAKSLPQIESEVTQLLEKKIHELKALPDLPDNTEHEVKKSLREFSEAARRNIDDFKNVFNALPKDFRACVVGIHPKFVLKDQSDIPFIELSDSEDESTPTASTPSKRRNMAPPTTPSKRMRSATPASSSTVKHEDSSQTNGATNGGNGTPRPQSLPQRRFAAPFDKFEHIGKGFATLAQVRQQMEEMARAGMPDIITVEVYQSLALRGLQPIGQPMETFLEETEGLIRGQLLLALNNAFKDLKNRIIFQECKKFLEAFLKKHTGQAKRDMMRCYRMELSQIITWDPESLGRYKNEEHLTLTRFRHKQRMIAYGDAQAVADRDKPLPQRMSDAEREADTKKRNMEITQKIGEDRFAREIEVIAFVRGYYRLAAQRFVDCVTQCVFCLMIPAIRDELSLYLDEKLGLIGSNVNAKTYERLMEENPKMAKRRETLRREKVKFEMALESIKALKKGDVDCVSSDELEDDTVMADAEV